MAERADLGSLLDVKFLLLFTLLYTTRSVTRTAEELGQSQPNVSVWLNKLRKQLGDPLFVRTASGMQPTPRADSLVEPIREALQSLRRISAPAEPFVAARARRTFRICMTDGSHITMLPQLLAFVREHAPTVRLEASPIGDDTAGELESGRADLALGILTGNDSGLYQQAFYAQDFICLASPRHSTIGTSLSLKAYREAAHVEVLSGKSNAILEQSLKDQGIARNVWLQVPGFLGLATVVAQTDLLATVPREIGETLARNGGLRVLKCPLKVPTFAVNQYWHLRMHQDPANRWLRTVCAELYARRKR